MEYIKGKKNIAVDVLSRLHNNGNQETTHEAMNTCRNYKKYMNCPRSGLLYILTSVGRPLPIRKKSNAQSIKRVIFTDPGIL